MTGLALVSLAALAFTLAALADRPPPRCPAHTGPAWNLDGEPCGCTLPTGHDGDHECDCGTWWAADTCCCEREDSDL